MRSERAGVSLSLLFCISRLFFFFVPLNFRTDENETTEYSVVSFFE